MKKNKGIIVTITAALVLTWNYAEQVDAKISNYFHSCIDPSIVPTKKNAMVYVPKAKFNMGSNQGYSDEGPSYSVTLDGFWIDRHEVTNSQFEAFVEETGYITIAERVPEYSDKTNIPPNMLIPGSAVFTPPNIPSKSGQELIPWWTYVPGANWKHPEGPNSSIKDKGNYPVVHIAFEDAKAYADWAKRDLPTEAQFELVARNKFNNKAFEWGNSLADSEGDYNANTWQGIFPIQDTKEDGYAGIAPVGCFKANNYGTHDLIGNVWEWTGNWYSPTRVLSSSHNPKGPAKPNNFEGEFPTRVLKGGSFLCSPNFCYRYRPAARIAQDSGLGSNHIGFRTVLNEGN